MPPGSPANKELRLLAEYATATRHYSWAVSKLASQRGTASHEDYQELRSIAQDAFAACERARRAVRDFRTSKA